MTSACLGHLIFLHLYQPYLVFAALLLRMALRLPVLWVHCIPPTLVSFCSSAIYLHWEACDAHNTTQSPEVCLTEPGPKLSWLKKFIWKQKPEPLHLFLVLPRLSTKTLSLKHSYCEYNGGHPNACLLQPGILKHIFIIILLSAKCNFC